MADVAIFWDYENCHPAANGSGFEVVSNIRSLAHNFGSVKLFKAYLELPEQSFLSTKLYNLRSELQSSGVSLTDCPHNGRKNVADMMILVDMLAYAIDHPTPATIILISGDRDFAYAAAVLRLRRYQVVLVSPTTPGPHISLKSQASECYDWNLEIIGKMESESISASLVKPSDIEVSPQRKPSSSVSLAQPIYLVPTPPVKSRLGHKLSMSENDLDWNASHMATSGLSPIIRTPEGSLASCNSEWKPSTEPNFESGHFMFNFRPPNFKHAPKPPNSDANGGYFSTTDRPVDLPKWKGLSLNAQANHSLHQAPYSIKSPWVTDDLSIGTNGGILPAPDEGSSAPVPGTPLPSTSTVFPDIKDHAVRPEARQLLSISRLATTQPVVRPANVESTPIIRSQSTHPLSVESTSTQLAVPLVHTLSTAAKSLEVRGMGMMVEGESAQAIPNDAFQTIPFEASPQPRAASSAASFPPFLSDNSSSSSYSPVVSQSMMPVFESLHQIEVAQGISEFSESSDRTTSVESPSPLLSVLNDLSSVLPSPVSMSSGSQKLDITAIQPTLAQATPPINSTINLSGPSRPDFDLLIELLQAKHAKGYLRPSREILAMDITRRDKLVYLRAGVTRLSEYLAIAEQHGLIQTGGSDADAWVALRSGWRDTQAFLSLPPEFKLLVERLRIQLSNGIERPDRSSVAVDLAAQDQTVYKRAGVSKFRQFIKIAEQRGIVQTGGAKGGWITLHSDWRCRS